MAATVPTAPFRAVIRSPRRANGPSAEDNVLYQVECEYYMDHYYCKTLTASWDSEDQTTKKVVFDVYRIRTDAIREPSQEQSAQPVTPWLELRTRTVVPLGL